MSVQSAKVEPLAVERPDIRRSSVLQRISWMLLLGTLVLLPYEYWLPQLAVGRFTVTTLEAVWGLALASWLAGLLVERRSPHIPMAILGGISVMLLVGLASAALADGDNADATVFVGRSAAGWLLFMSAADQAVARRNVRQPLVAIVVGASVSAAIGLVLFASPTLRQALHVHEFAAAGAPRLDGTYDYPNTAAMAWEAAALLAVSLVAMETRRALAALWLGCVAVMVGAMVLTLSRGATAGAAIGMVAVAVVALLAGRRRLGVGILGAAAVLVIATLLIEIAVAPIARLFTDAEAGLYNATYQAPASATLNQGAATVEVQVTNTGTLTWNDAGQSDYSLGYHWLIPETGEIVADGADLTPLGTVAPGQTTTVEAVIHGPDSASGYQVGWDVTRDASGWFSIRGVPMVETAIQLGLPGGTGSLGSYAAVEPLVPPREDLWKAAIAMISERPLLGVGPGTYRLRYGSYLGMATWDERAYAHNVYLEIGATTGIVGLLAFLFVVGLAIAPLVRSLARRRRVEPDPLFPEPRTWIALGAILAAVIAFLGHGLFDYFFGFNPINGLWWATVALALAAPLVVLPRLDETT
ncbi:MAG TPA: O-antigen ligase family protein [Candidatus Limnocylindrales bacterium]